MTLETVPSSPSAPKLVHPDYLHTLNAVQMVKCISIGNNGLPLSMMDSSRQRHTFVPMRRWSHQGPGAFMVIDRVVKICPIFGSTVLFTIRTSATCESNDLCSKSANFLKLAIETRSQGCRYVCSCLYPLTILP